MFFFYGCLFHWFSKMQRSVTLSSAEAECFGAMLAAKEVIFIRELLKKERKHTTQGRDLA